MNKTILEQAKENYINTINKEFALDYISKKVLEASSLGFEYVTIHASKINAVVNYEVVLELIINIAQDDLNLQTDTSSYQQAIDIYGWTK